MMKNKIRNKLVSVSGRLSVEEIEHRIQLSREKKKQRIVFVCPACKQQWFKTRVLTQHLQSCCPELFAPNELQGVQDKEVQELQDVLKNALQQEKELQKAAIYYTYVETHPETRSIEQLAEILGLSVSRSQLLLKQALRSIPIVADSEGDLDIIYEDEGIIVVNKPAMINTTPVHRWKGGALLNRIYGYLGHIPRNVHRLDFETSGVVVMAKTQELASNLCQQFRRRTVKKTYLAIVLGEPKQTNFTVDAPIHRHPTIKEARIISTKGKSAVTEFTTLMTCCNFDCNVITQFGEVVTDEQKDQLANTKYISLVECKPQTGRTHQIRLHLQHVGHPIVGDPLYGCCIYSDHLNRLGLHAQKLQIEYPHQQVFSVVAEIANDMKAFLNQCQ